MTLSEYLNQEDPERHPHVALKRSEYTIGTTIMIGNEVRTQVFLGEKFHNAFPEIRNEYVKCGASDALYTTDHHGNPKSKSVFHVNFKHVSADNYRHVVESRRKNGTRIKFTWFEKL